MVKIGDDRAFGEKWKSGSTFRDDLSASQPSDTSILLQKGYANDT